MNSTNSKSLPKAKKSFTLSPESVEFLEATRRKRQVASISAVLDEILQNVRKDLERASLEQAFTDYYRSLSDQEMTEHAEWGELAEREFSKKGTPPSAH